MFDQGVNKSDEPYNDKRDNRKGDNDGITSSPDYADISTHTPPIGTNHPEEVVTQSPSRLGDGNSDGLGSSGASPKGDYATLYDDDDYESEGEDFVEFNHLFEPDHVNIPKSLVLRRFSRHYRIPASIEQLMIIGLKVKYDIAYVVHSLTQLMHAP
ncbi:hypothetical protein Tco_0990407 [Tanacetum coccineum]|uniref:Uncharacterized protein n=1 Tax=Tanacetum coccineum TaxID=301880 RepID=A0ABQ5EX61_9ASTR